MVNLRIQPHETQDGTAFTARFIGEGYSTQYDPENRVVTLGVDPKDVSAVRKRVAQLGGTIIGER